MFAKALAASGVAVAMIAGAAMLSVNSLSVGEAQDEVATSSGVDEAAQSDEEQKEATLSVTATVGTLSHLWGSVTQFAGHIWLVENDHGKCVVVADGDMLTSYFADGQDRAFARVEGGTPREFMDVLVKCSESNVAGGQECGECEDQGCCNVECEDNQSWCICTANVTCGERGVCQIHIGVETCEFTCCEK